MGPLHDAHPSLSTDAKVPSMCVPGAICKQPFSGVISISAKPYIYARTIEARILIVLMKVENVRHRHHFSPR